MRNAVSSGSPARAGERRMTARWSTTIAVSRSRGRCEGDAPVGGAGAAVVLDRLAGVDEEVVERQHHVGGGQAVPRWPRPYSHVAASTTATTWTRATPVREVVSIRPSRPAATTARTMATVGRTHVFGVNSVVSGQLTTRVASPARAVSGSRLRLMAPPPGSWRLRGQPTPRRRSPPHRPARHSTRRCAGRTPRTGTRRSRIVRHRPPSEAGGVGRAEPVAGPARMARPVPPGWRSEATWRASVFVEVGHDGDRPVPGGRHRVGRVQHLRELLELVRLGRRPGPSRAWSSSMVWPPGRRRRSRR